MWIDIISFSVHWLMAIAFFMLIPFPFFLKGMDGDNIIFIKKTYRWIIHFAHIAVIGTLLTGIFLVSQWVHWWTVSILILWLIIGFFLGMTAKSIRHSLDTTERQPALKYSTFLTVFIVVMFILKFSSWF